MADYIYNKIKFYTKDNKIIDEIKNMLKIDNAGVIYLNDVFLVFKDWEKEYNEKIAFANWGVYKCLFDCIWNENELSFTTSWTIPIKTIEKLSKKFANVKIVCFSYKEYYTDFYFYEFNAGKINKLGDYHSDYNLKLNLSEKEIEKIDDLLIEKNKELFEFLKTKINKMFATKNKR